jgi:hypothetical protein
LDPSEISGDNLNNVRRVASGHFRNKKLEYLKDKINELATNSKNKSIRDLYRRIYNFKKGYQARSNLMKMKIVICLHTRLGGPRSKPTTSEKNVLAPGIKHGTLNL